jgi:NOL1/NOP2/sun family putative RNA methylase
MLARDFFSKYSGLIPDYQDFLDSIQGPVPTSIRLNTLLGSPEQILGALVGEGVEPLPCPLGPEFRLAPGLEHPGRLLLHSAGYIYSQSLGSGIPALALGPRPEHLVLDMCAAPGSKTTQMAAMMGNRGRIVANEPSPKRHPGLLANLHRMAVLNTVVTAYSGQDFPMRVRFQRILVDAPCSGEGNGRVDPQGQLVGTTCRGGDLHLLQRRLLTRGFDLLEEGGVLVYSTCSYDPMENEAVVDHLLRERPARVLPIELRIPHEQGITSWQGQRFKEEISNAWRIYPHRLNTVGFFLARLTRA